LRVYSILICKFTEEKDEQSTLRKPRHLFFKQGAKYNWEILQRSDRCNDRAS